MENKTITIKLVRSLLGRSAKQIATAKSLGLTKRELLNMIEENDL